MVEKDDLDLIYGIKANDEKYLKLLVDRYAKPLRSILMKSGFSREDSLEIVNDTFYKAIRYIDSFDVEKFKKFSNWLFKIAQNTAIDKYRKDSKSPIKESLEEREEKGFQDTAILFHPTSSNKSEIGLLSKELLNKALENLSPIDCEILLNRAWGREHKVIARSLNKTENAVKVAYLRAKSKLKEEYIILLESIDDSKQISLKAYLDIEKTHEKPATR